MTGRRRLNGGFVGAQDCLADQLGRLLDDLELVLRQRDSAPRHLALQCLRRQRGADRPAALAKRQGEGDVVGGVGDDDGEALLRQPRDQKLLQSKDGRCVETIAGARRDLTDTRGAALASANGASSKQTISAPTRHIAYSVPYPQAPSVRKVTSREVSGPPPTYTGRGSPCAFNYLFRLPWRPCWPRPGAPAPPTTTWPRPAAIRTPARWRRRWPPCRRGSTRRSPGDTVYIRGGTYKITTPATSGAGINFTKSGTSDTNRIKYWAYPGEVPVFDFSDMVDLDDRLHARVRGERELPALQGARDLLRPDEHVLQQRRRGDGSGGNDIFELLNMHHNSGNGIFIGSKSGRRPPGAQLRRARQLRSRLRSQGQGQNADGFGVHYQTSGAHDDHPGLPRVVELRRRLRSDQPGGPGHRRELLGDGQRLRQCTAPPIPSTGNGNGFKMGSSTTGVRHLVQNNVAWKNKASGFYANHSTGGNTWYNNTSFMNGTQYNMLASPADDPNMTITLTGSLAHIMRNNIGYPNRNSNMTGVDTMFNSWDLSITPANRTSLSISDPSVSGTGHEHRSVGRARTARGRRQHAEHRLSEAGRGQPDDRQGDERRASVRGRRAGSRRVRVRRRHDDWKRRHDRHRRNHRRGRQHGGGQRRRAAEPAVEAPARGGTAPAGTGGVATVGTGGTGGGASGAAGMASGAAGAPAGTGGSSVTGSGGNVGSTGAAGATGGASDVPGESGSGGCACSIDATGDGASILVLAAFVALSSVSLGRRRRRT